MKLSEETVVGLSAHLSRFLKKSSRDNIPALAGQSAFFLILSAVPFLLFGFSVVSIMFGQPKLPVQVTGVEDQMDDTLRSAVVFIEQSIRRSGSGTTVITAIIALWSAGRGIYSITEGISRVYELPNRHTWLVKRILAMGYTVVMQLILLLGLAVIGANLYFADAIYQWTGSHTFVRVMLYIVFYILFGILVTLVITLALKLFLRKRVGDKRCRSMRALLPGMVLTVVAWNGLTFGVMVYIRHFMTSSIYGSMGSLFILMMWIYFMMYLLLFGIQLDYIYRDRFYDLKLWDKLKPNPDAPKRSGRNKE